MSAPELNRDVQWLEFNRRVLHEAKDERTPLLERLRFLGIFTSNLDEFFMKRGARLAARGPTGAPATTLRPIIEALLGDQARAFRDELVPALEREGIHLAGYDALDVRQRAAADAYFERQVFPVLTPLAVDPGHPFPLVSNLSLSLGVLLDRPERADEPLFARVKVPGALPPWIPIDERGREVWFVNLVELVARHLDRLFPGMRIVASMPFRVTRSSDVEREDEPDAADLLEEVAGALRERRFAPVVRLEHAKNPHPRILAFLVGELELAASEVYELAGELDYTTLQPVVELARPELKFEPWTPVVPAAFEGADASLFTTLRAGDLLVHHPYESFAETVERFVAVAASDPKVRALKMTLYRTGDGSPFLPMLQRAAESGKQVVCVVELKARFDEARNIAVARALEKAGVHVVYGVVGLKTHCKMVLVVREDADGIRSYAHVGTGNYNPKTAQLYTDLGLFTARADVTSDVVELFNLLTGRSLQRDYRRLLVAPSRMKEGFLWRIAREADNARRGKPARIVARMNSLEDKEICAALVDASNAGVPIDLVVRGFATLRPGVEGETENVRIVSIVGRFLEHARVYHFANGEADPTRGEFLLGSADWMHRNLDARVEACVPVDDGALKERLWEMLSVQLADRRQAWEMRADGSYVQRTPVDPAREVGSQARLMALARLRAVRASVEASFS